MAYPGELAYYQSVSGLPADRTLAEHKRAYFIAASSAPADATIGEAEYAFYLFKTALPRASTAFIDARYAYYRSQLPGNTGTVGDLMCAFFANPVTPVSAIVLSSTRANPVSLAGGSTTTLRAVLTGGTAASVVDLWLGFSAGTETESAIDLVFVSGSTFEYVLDLTGGAGVTYYLVAKVGAVASNEISVAIVA